MGRTLESYAVDAGDILTVSHVNVAHARSSASNWSEFQAKKRLDNGKNYEHLQKQLCQGTQAVVMQESAHLAQKIDKTTQQMGQQVAELKEAITVGTRKIEESHNTFSQVLENLRTSQILMFSQDFLKYSRT